MDLCGRRASGTHRASKSVDLLPGWTPDAVLRDTVPVANAVRIAPLRRLIDVGYTSNMILWIGYRLDGTATC
jgi:hypothetical protein